MSTLREDVRISMLGAAGGLFSMSVFLLITRVDSYYNYLSWLEETDYAQYDRAVEDLWWLPVSFWHVMLSIVASLIVHRYLRNNSQSPFLIWQAIGIIALLGWGITFSFAVTLRFLMDGGTRSLESILMSIDPVFIAKFVSSVFACNVCYGSAMQSCSRQYVEGKLLSSRSDEAEAQLSC